MRMRCYYIRKGARRHILQSVTKQTLSLSLLHLLAMQSKYEFGALPLLYQYRTSIMIMHKDVWIINSYFEGANLALPWLNLSFSPFQFDSVPRFPSSPNSSLPVPSPFLLFVSFPHQYYCAAVC